MIILWSPSRFNQDGRALHDLPASWSTRAWALLAPDAGASEREAADPNEEQTATKEDVNRPEPELSLACTRTWRSLPIPRHVACSTVHVRAKADLSSARDKSDFIARHGYAAFAKLPFTARL